MKPFFTPTTASVFGLDDEFNEDTKRVIVDYEIQEGLDSTWHPTNIYLSLLISNLMTFITWN